MKEGNDGSPAAALLGGTLKVAIPGGTALGDQSTVVKYEQNTVIDLKVMEIIYRRWAQACH